MVLFFVSDKNIDRNLLLFLNLELNSYIENESRAYALALKLILY
jgi:hypothetical protein